MPQFEQVLVLVVMTILVALFAWMFARDRQSRALWWMVGWISIEIHFMPVLLPKKPEWVAFLAGWLWFPTLLVAAASFFRSVTEVCRTRTRKLVFWGLLFAPALGYWTLMRFKVRGPVLYESILGLMLAAGIGLALVHARRGPIPYVACAVAAGPAIWAACQNWWKPAFGVECILFESFLLTGCAYWRRFRRFTPGVT